MESYNINEEWGGSIVFNGAPIKIAMVVDFIAQASTGAADDLGLIAGLARQTTPSSDGTR